MAEGDIDIANGATFVLAAYTPFMAQLLTVEVGSMSRASVGTAHMGTTTAETFIPGSHFDPGEVSVTMRYNSTLSVPISAAASTLVVTWPDANTFSCQAFVTEFAITGGDATVLDASATLKISGAFTGITIV